MDAEEVMKLMDSCWFQRRVFHSKHAFPSLPHRKVDRSEEKAKASPAKNLQIRSYSDRCIAVDLEADSPTSVIFKPKLQKIPSGKEALDLARRKDKREKPRFERRERGISRSLSALEFEEVKGFMDLGFVFNEEETNRSLASIIPGLQKRAEMAASGGSGVEVSRPYLSEAWGDLKWRRNDGNILMNWKSMKNEIDIKDHLKIWAHVVASKIR